VDFEGHKIVTSAKVSLRETFADVGGFQIQLSIALCRASLVILFVGVLLLNLMAVTKCVPTPARWNERII